MSELDQVEAKPLNFEQHFLAVGMPARIPTGGKCNHARLTNRAKRAPRQVILSGAKDLTSGLAAIEGEIAFHSEIARFLACARDDHVRAANSIICA